VLLFGKAIAEFQGIQFMRADMGMEVAVARQLSYAAAARSERAMQGETVPDLTFISSACKCFTFDVAMEVTTDAVQLLLRVRRRARLPGRADARLKDHPNLRRDQPDPAHVHGPPAPEVAGIAGVSADPPREGVGSTTAN